MHCSRLHIVQFKNYTEASLEFSAKFNCFTGNNGSGKTNLMDAIYYLSFSKGFTNAIDSQNIRFGSDFFMIQGYYQINGQEDELYCGMKRNQRKVFKRNKKEYERFSDHIGQYPLVLLSPSDTQLILGGSDERRRFIDGVISQYDNDYLHHLIQYSKALQQRNALLKSFVERRFFDEDSLEIWDEQLLQYASPIFESRKNFFLEFLPVFNTYYGLLSGEKETVDIEYQSSLWESDLRSQLLSSRQKDRMMQHTTCGIHKDELVFTIHQVPVKRFGSQGQQKTFIIALKLAQFAFTSRIKGYHPILLFDDVFDKLDEERVQKLMQLVADQDFGQVFVSDTHTDRIVGLFQNIKAPCRIFEVDNGSISRIFDTQTA